MRPDPFSFPNYGAARRGLRAVDAATDALRRSDDGARAFLRTLETSDRFGDGAGAFFRTSTAELAGTAPLINPGFPGPGRTQNCVFCAIATDATFAGNPASAMPSKYPQPIPLVSDARGGKWFGIEDKELIEHVMTELGPGSRGVVYGKRTTSAHVFNVVVDSGGTVKFFDGQTGKAATWNGYKSFKLLITNSAP